MFMNDSFFSSPFMATLTTTIVVVTNGEEYSFSFIIDQSLPLIFTIDESLALDFTIDQQHNFNW